LADLALDFFLRFSASGLFHIALALALFCTASILAFASISA